MTGREPATSLPSKVLLCLLLAVVALSVCARGSAALAGAGPEVSAADGAIGAAFAAVEAAERSGGNVSALDAQLNQAIGLVQEAESVNATDPAAASADLQNATSIAQAVATAAPSAGQTGGASREAAQAQALGSAAVILAGAALVYAYGARAYRLAWLRAHRDYVVSRSNG